jgi:folate-binding protein YgfZ
MVSQDGYDAARWRIGAIDRVERGRIVVSGADRASYLQGLLTNDIAALKAGEGCYTAYLTPQGRMIADLYVYELGDVMLVTVPKLQHRTVLDKFEQFLFTEDVRLGDASDSFSTIAIVGPDAARFLSESIAIAESDLLAMAEHACRRSLFEGDPVIVTRVADTGEPGYDVYVEAAKADAFRRIIEAGNVPFVDSDAADALRLEAGIPKFGQDMDEETIPLEAGIESRAISFSKGCYVGQEVIIRVLHRGHGRVARKLVGLLLDGEIIPPPGASVAVDGRDIGKVTSAALSPALQKPIALAYLHRDFLTPGTVVAINSQPATVVDLPFVRPKT